MKTRLGLLVGASPRFLVLLTAVGCSLAGLWGTSVIADVRQVTVSFYQQVRGDEILQPIETSIVATAISSGGRETASEIRFDGLKIPGSYELGLDPEYVWKLELVGGSVWAPPAILHAGERDLAIHAWPTGEVVGVLRTPADSEIPLRLALRFETAPAARSLRGGPPIEQAQVECGVTESRFACQLPQGVLDLRLRATGFVSHYVWNADVDPDRPLDLGTVRLRPGASVVGTVAAAEGMIRPDSCEIALVPATSASPRSAGEEQRLAVAALRAEVSPSGFFHFPGVAPGAYTLLVAHPGFATAEIHPVTVLPGSETTLRDPVLLQRPAELELFIDPPTDAFGEPWMVELAAIGRIPGILDSRGRAAAEPDGSYVKSGLDPGRYVVAVFDSRSQRVAWEEIEVESGGGAHFLELGLLWVEGLVTLGEEPLEAELVFGGRDAPVQVAMESDEEGTFGGFLPREGDWRVLVQAVNETISTTVSVEVEPGEDEIAEVTIELPDTRVHGRVVDRSRRGVEGAMVKVVEAAAGTIDWRRTGAKGSFELRGVSEGVLVIDASLADDLSSAPQVLAVTEGRSLPEIELVLEERTPLRGSVVSSSGPVAGASVVAIAKMAGIEPPFARRPHAMTDALGTFSLAIPSEADRIDLVVLPPGFALTTRSLFADWRDPVEISVSEYGGDLVLELDKPLEWPGEPRAPSPLLVHRGVVLDAALLHHWATLKLERNEDPTRFVVPNLAPGAYSACWFTYPGFARFLQTRGAGALVPGECVGGHLAPYGELRLSLPAPPGDDAREESEPRRGSNP